MHSIFFSFFLIVAVFLSSCEKAELPYEKAVNLQPVEVRSEVDKAQATTGDIITFTVTVNWREDLSMNLPEFGSSIADLRITDMGSDELLEIDGRKIQKKWYKLRADIIGSYRIPAISIPYHIPGSEEESKAKTSPIFIQVVSTLEDKENLTGLPNGIRPLEEVPANYRREIIMGLVLLLILLTGYFIYRYYQTRKMAREAAPPPPPHEVALKELARLKKRKLSSLDSVRTLYFDLSEVFRRYLQDRFEFPAVDWTTEEIDSYIQQNHFIEAPMKDASTTFIRNTDQVKFARHFPDTSKIEKEFETAEQFIHNTKEIPQTDPVTK